jgi:hypothetical protein
MRLMRCRSQKRRFDILILISVVIKSAPPWPRILNLPYVLFFLCTGIFFFYLVVSILHWSCAHMWMFRIDYQAVRMVFSRVLAFHYGGPGSIPGRNMSVLGPLV